MHIPHSLHLLVIMLTRNFVLEALTRLVLVDVCVACNPHHLIVFSIKVKKYFAEVKTNLSKDDT